MENRYADKKKHSVFNDASMIYVFKVLVFLLMTKDQRKI